MPQPLYIIPGLGESATAVRYKKLAADLKKKGYTPKLVSPDWYTPLSCQIFEVEKNATIIGFSIGAVLAYLIGQKYPCKKLILASLSPIHAFSKTKEIQMLTRYMTKEQATAIVTDWKQIRINLTTSKTPCITLKGTLERDVSKAQIEIPEAKHYMGKAYRETIGKVVG